MKKFMCVFLVLALLVLSGCTGNTPETQEGKITVAASFFPVYIFTLNLLDGIDEIKVSCMAEQSVGCLHDYTLTAKDAKLLNDASVLVVNGAGMESFLEDAVQSVENLKVIDSSQNIELLCNEEHHEETSHTHHHENSHIWLSVDNAKIQVENIKNGLSTEFPEYKDIIEDNYSNYIKRLELLTEKRNSIVIPDKALSVISFHGAFEYLGEDMGFSVEDTIESDDGGEPSAKKLADLSMEIKEKNIKALFVEPNYNGSAAEILSRETDADVYVLNPIVSGEVKLSAYEDIMNENYETIRRISG